MTKCYKCGGETKPQKVTWTVSVGGHEDVHDVTADVCTACGEWTLGAQDIEHLELKTALRALGRQRLTGAVLKDVRKTLGLKQTELGEKLGIAWETISRWESEKRSMEPWVKAALMGLVFEGLLPHQEREFAEVTRKQEAFWEEFKRREAQFDASVAELQELRRARRA